jgi:cell division protein FtsL
MAHLDEVKPELARLEALIADQERAIHLLCQPVGHLFKLEPMIDAADPLDVSQN